MFHAPSRRVEIFADMISPLSEFRSGNICTSPWGAPMTVVNIFAAQTAVMADRRFEKNDLDQGDFSGDASRFHVMCILE